MTTDFLKNTSCILSSMSKAKSIFSSKTVFLWNRIPTTPFPIYKLSREKVLYKTFIRGKKSYQSQNIVLNNVFLF